MNKKQTIYSLIAIVLMVVIDQVSKVITISQLALRERITVIDNFFALSHIKNTGISVGAFSDAGPIFYIAVYALAIGVFVFLAKDINFKTKKLYSICILMMIAGGVGNLIDRLFFGEVTDMLILILFGRELFGVFNIADVLLVVGMVLFTYDLVVEDIIKPRWNKKPTE